MRPPFIPTTSLAEDVSDRIRSPPLLYRGGNCDWRNLTYDSSIQILNLETEDTSQNGLRFLTRTNRDSNQIMSSISKYDSEVMSSHFLRDNARSRILSTSDIVTSTWDNLKDARLVSYLKEENMSKRFTYNKTPPAIKDGGAFKTENRNLCYKPAKFSTKKHVQVNPYSDCVLDLSRSSKYDVHIAKRDRKDCGVTNTRILTAPYVIKEPQLVEPLHETRHASKLGPIKRVKLSTLQNESRPRRQGKYGLSRNHTRRAALSLRPDDNRKVRQTPGLSSTPLAATFVETAFPMLTNGCGSLSNFLIENETIPSINSAIPVAVSSQTKSAKCVKQVKTRTPSLRSTKSRSIATSNLRYFKCKRTLAFNGSFENNTKQISNSKNIRDEFREYETVLNLCTRKPRLGFAIKIDKKQVILNNDSIADMKLAISNTKTRLNIKTNGTINMLSKTIKMNSQYAESPRRKNSSPFNKKRPMHTISTDFPFRTVFESQRRFLQKLVKSQFKRRIKHTRMRPPFIPTKSLAEDVSDIFRSPSSLDQGGICDWRNLTYDSSIHILNLETDDTSQNGLRFLSRTNRDTNQNMISISEYDLEAMSSHFLQNNARSRILTNFTGNISTSDILTNTWDNLIDARQVSYLKEVNMIKRFTYNKTPPAIKDGGALKTDYRKLCYKQAKFSMKKHVQVNSYIDCVLDLSRSSKFPREQTGNDVHIANRDRKDCGVTNTQTLTAPYVIKEPKLVEPLHETRHASKLGPVKRVKLSTFQNESRPRRQGKYGLSRNQIRRAVLSLTPDNNRKVRQTPGLSSIPLAATFVETAFPMLINGCGSLSNFLIENETIPSINSATSVAVSSQTKSAKCVELEQVCTRTPSLLSTKLRSIATSNLRYFQCKRMLDFNGSFENNTKQISNSENICDEFREYETVLNLCTRKPRLGLAIKKDKKQVILNNVSITDIKHAISNPKKRLNIKTNGTINLLSKTIKMNSHTTKSPRRKNSSTCNKKRRMQTISRDFESHV